MGWESSFVGVHCECQELPVQLKFPVWASETFFLISGKVIYFFSTAIALGSTRVTGEEGGIFPLTLLDTFANDDWWAKNRAVWATRSLLGRWDLSIHAQNCSEWAGRVAACLAVITAWLSTPLASPRAPDNSGLGAGGAAPEGVSSNRARWNEEGHLNHQESSYLIPALPLVCCEGPSKSLLFTVPQFPR